MPVIRKPATSSTARPSGPSATVPPGPAVKMAIATSMATILFTSLSSVRAHHRLLTEHLGVRHLRLVLGNSMGGMHTWVWGETHPEFMDALMPLACLPVRIAGRRTGCAGPRQF